MNKEKIRQHIRRCRFGISNPKKDVYARRNSRYKCVNRKFSLEGIIIK